jgi:hypothetical protein
MAPGPKVLKGLKFDSGFAAEGCGGCAAAERLGSRIEDRGPRHIVISTGAKREWRNLPVILWLAASG